MGSILNSVQECSYLYRVVYGKTQVQFQRLITAYTHFHVLMVQVAIMRSSHEMSAFYASPHMNLVYKFQKHFPFLTFSSFFSTTFKCHNDAHTYTRRQKPTNQ